MEAAMRSGVRLSDSLSRSTPIASKRIRAPKAARARSGSVTGPVPLQVFRGRSGRPAGFGEEFTRSFLPGRSPVVVVEGQDAHVTRGPGRRRVEPATRALVGPC